MGRPPSNKVVMYQRVSPKCAYGLQRISEKVGHRLKRVVDSGFILEQFVTLILAGKISLSVLLPEDIKELRKEFEK